MSVPNFLMPQEQVIEELKNFFDIRELVDEATFNKWGDRAWMFFDYRLLVNLLWLRVEIDKSITVNTWLWGGRFDERGLRTTVSPLVVSRVNRGRLYLTAHLRGQAIDFDVKGMTANEVRAWLVAKGNEVPFPIRLERNLNGSPISWTHLDVVFEAHNPHVYEFDIS